MSQRLLHRKESIKLNWNCCHTICALFARVWPDALAKNLNIFYVNYAVALNVSRDEFSAIMIARLVGSLLAMFTSAINNKLLKSSRVIAALYVLLDGIFALLFITPMLIGGNLFINHWSSWQTILYCSCIWFLFGLSCPSSKSATIAMASKFSANNRKGRNISYLGMSWALATMLFVPIGYMIDYVDWYVPFLSLGSLCIVATFVVLCAFQDDITNKNTKTNTNTNTSSTALLSVFKSKVCNYIIWSHAFAALACGSIETAISGPWLQDVYNFSISQTGYIGFVVFGGEMTGTLLIATFADKYGVFVFAVLSYGIFLGCCTLVCLLSVFIGSDVGGLYVPFAVNFIYFVGWKMFWSALQVGMVKYSPSHIQNRTGLIANYSMTAVGRIPGIFLTTHFWDNGNGITKLSYIWIGAILISSIFWIFLYRHVQHEERIQEFQQKQNEAKGKQSAVRCSISKRTESRFSAKGSIN